MGGEGCVRHRTGIFFCALLCINVLTALPARADPADRNFGILLFGGVLTDGNWKEAINPTTGQTVDSQMLGLAGSWTWHEIWHDRVSFEIEAAVIKHFGLQEHVEFTAVPLAARWHWFPWSDHVSTTLGFGVGMSYAARPPQAEIVVRAEAKQLLFGWYAEATVGPPERVVEGVFRIQHRSSGFGLLEPRGRAGSDFLTGGLRVRF